MKIFAATLALGLLAIGHAAPAHAAALPAPPAAPAFEMDNVATPATWRRHRRGGFSLYIGPRAYGYANRRYHGYGHGYRRPYVYGGGWNRGYRGGYDRRWSGQRHYR